MGNVVVVSRVWMPGDTIPAGWTFVGEYQTPEHKIRAGGTVHAMDCQPCMASPNAHKPHLDPRYETYWSM